MHLIAQPRLFSHLQDLGKRSLSYAVERGTNQDQDCPSWGVLNTLNEPDFRSNTRQMQ